MPRKEGQKSTGQAPESDFAKALREKNPGVRVTRRQAEVRQRSGWVPVDHKATVV